MKSYNQTPSLPEVERRSPTVKMHEKEARMKLSWHFVFALLFSLFLAGCANPTPYGPASEDWRGGYEDAYVQRGTYNVSFSGNGFTSATTAKSYFLYRCAEITVHAGYDYFVIIDGNAITNYAVMGQGAGAATVAKPSFTGTIRLFKGHPPANNPNAYDAHEVMKNIGPTLLREK